MSGIVAETADLLVMAQAAFHGKAGVRPMAGTGEEERRWRSVYGAVVCARCHPPASPTLGAAWEDVAMEKTLETKEEDR